ncbi:hypothetical protein ACFPRL_09885 [Pseudoclavibacter helvolus]
MRFGDWRVALRMSRSLGWVCRNFHPGRPRPLPTQRRATPLLHSQTR